MRLRSVRIISSILIVVMLVAFVTYLNVSREHYAFSYQNSEIIYNGNRDFNKISLMFNVYWGTEYIDDILDLLDVYEAKCTFFVGGQWVEKESEKLIKIYNRGHEIGNHGYLHRDHEHLDYEQNYDEIHINHELVKSVLNIDMHLFAPPSGSFNQSTISACKNLGYQAIMWSRDTIDWRDQDANLIFNRATKNIKGGEFILAHPTECTLKALQMILEYYKINNFCVTTVSENLK